MCGILSAHAFLLLVGFPTHIPPTTTTYECQLIVVYSCPGGTGHGFKVFNRMDFLPFIIPV